MGCATESTSSGQRPIDSTASGVSSPLTFTSQDPTPSLTQTHLWTRHRLPLPERKTDPEFGRVLFFLMNTYSFDDERSKIFNKGSQYK